MSFSLLSHQNRYHLVCFPQNSPFNLAAIDDLRQFDTKLINSLSWRCRFKKLETSDKSFHLDKALTRPMEWLLFWLISMENVSLGGFKQWPAWKIFASGFFSSEPNLSSKQRYDLHDRFFYLNASSSRRIRTNDLEIFEAKKSVWFSMCRCVCMCVCVTAINSTWVFDANDEWNLNEIL